jgi:manganese/zinc/iron transport system ATP- binding protein
LRGKQVTVLVSTHDLDMALQQFELVLLLNKSFIAFGPSEEVLTAEMIRKTFGQRVHFLDGAAVIDDCCPPD